MNEIINFGDGKSVKVMLLKGEAGNDIESIELTSSSGVVDTYTITLTDGTTETFQVTNGSSIQSIDKTSTEGLVDTYTVTLTNGNTSTFTVTNGEYDVPSSQGRNLITYPYYNTSPRTIYGITFTENTDGSITANGTATSDANHQLLTRTINNDLLKRMGKGTFTLSGCPSGGNGKYYITMGHGTPSAFIGTLATDIGNGSVFTISDDISNNNAYINITIKSGTTVDNLTFKPMLEVGTIAHAYEPTTQSALSLRTSIANVEDGSVASKTYNAGDYILRNGQLHKVTTTIASGAAITEGVNIESVTVGGEMSEINNNLSDKLLVRQYSVTTGTYGQFNIPSLTGYRPISIETSDLTCLGIQNSGLLGSYSATLVTLDANGKYVPSANNTIYINVVYAKI